MEKKKDYLDLLINLKEQTTDSISHSLTPIKLKT